MIDSAFLNEIQKFNLIVNKRVTSKYTGERKSSYSGAGTIFRDHRMYSLGDNFKAIDWRVFARTDDLYVKQFEEERNLSVHILIDSSASMAYHDKFEFAGKLGLGFAFLAMKNNEKISFSTFSAGVESFKGSRGRSQILSMLAHINSIKPSGVSSIYDSFKMYKKSLRSKSFIVVISDMLMDAGLVCEALKILGREHTVRVIQVLDRDEKEMPLDGDFIFSDSESGFRLRTYVSKRAQSEYIRRLGAHTTEIMNACSGLGMKFYQFTTSKPLFDAFFEMLG